MPKRPTLGFAATIHSGSEVVPTQVETEKSQVSDSSQAVRKISIASGDISFKARQVMKSRVRGDIRTLIA